MLRGIGPLAVKTEYISVTAIMNLQFGSARKKSAAAARAEYYAKFAGTDGRTGRGKTFRATAELDLRRGDDDAVSSKSSCGEQERGLLPFLGTQRVGQSAAGQNRLPVPC